MTVIIIVALMQPSWMKILVPFCGFPDVQCGICNLLNSINELALFVYGKLQLSSKAIKSVVFTRRQLGK